MVSFFNPKSVGFGTGLEQLNRRTKMKIGESRFSIFINFCDPKIGINLELQYKKNTFGLQFEVMGRTKPVSIRFDPEKLELIKRKEKLPSGQKVVDFLMDAYWWNQRLVLAPAMAEAAKHIPYLAKDQPATALEAYDQKIRDAMTPFEVEAVGKLMDVDPFLSRKDRETLVERAKKKTQSFED
jgi:hypothetical protein